MTEGITIASIFAAGGEVLTGYISTGLNFVDAMWANPFGQVAIAGPLALGAGFTIYGLFTHRKRKRH